MKVLALFCIISVAAVLFVTAEVNAGCGSGAVIYGGKVVHTCGPRPVRHRVKKHKITTHKPEAVKREIVYHFDKSEVAALKNALFNETGRAVRVAVPKELARYMPTLRQVVRSELAKDALLRQKEYANLPRASVWQQFILPLATLILAVALVISLLAKRR